MAASISLRRRLIMMVKEPRMGAVKTRLARDIGPVRAAQFYRCVTANLLRRLGSDPRWEVILAISPDTATGSASWPSRIRRIGQGRGDLGVRMERCLRSCGQGPAALIGSDIPGIDSPHIAEAFRLLDRNDAVFGPADDGGFWLVGLKPMPRLSGLFRNVRWSSAYALSDTLINLAGKTVGLAANLTDVDDAASFGSAAQLGMRTAVLRNGA